MFWSETTGPDCNIIWQICFFGDPLPRLFKPSWFVKKWPPGGRAYFHYISIYIENFKNLLFRKPWTDFNITWQECSFGGPLPKLFMPSWFVKIHNHVGRGLFSPLYLYLKCFCQKPLNRFQYNFAEMFLWWPTTKIVKIIRILKTKTWPSGGGVGLISSPSHSV